MRAPHAGLPAAAADTSASCGLPAAATACWADLHVAGDSRFFEACLLTGDWNSHFSRESQYSVGAGHRRLHRNMQCYFSIVPGLCLFFSAMLSHSIPTAFSFSSSSDCALSVSLHCYSTASSNGINRLATVPVLWILGDSRPRLACSRWARDLCMVLGFRIGGRHT